MTLPSAHKQTPTGWQDDRLMQAYDLIWEVQQANKGLGTDSDFGSILDKIEGVDELLKDLRGEQSNG